MMIIASLLLEFNYFLSCLSISIVLMSWNDDDDIGGGGGDDGKSRFN